MRSLKNWSVCTVPIKKPFGTETKPCDLLEKPLEDEFRELVKDEYREKAERTAVLEDQLRILLIPKDPNDQKK